MWSGSRSVGSSPWKKRAWNVEQDKAAVETEQVSTGEGEARRGPREVQVAADEEGMEECNENSPNTKRR
jgi:hypothetical protein